MFQFLSFPPFFYADSVESLLQRALEERPSHRGTQLQLCKVKCDLGFLIFDTTHDGPMKQFFTCQSHETLEIATDLVSNALTEAKQVSLLRCPCRPPNNFRSWSD